MSIHSTHSAHLHRDDEGSRLGMWIFLFTEMLLFFGLFLVYSVYRAKHFSDFHIAAHHLNVIIGAVNTIILLISSATVAMSISAVQMQDKPKAVRLLLITIGLAFVFLINKYFEWGGKIDHLLYPGSELVASLKQGQILFFGLYYFMTGLHAFHIIIGIVILAYITHLVNNGKINAGNYVLLENGGLYWHLVDLIWIFLFPLLYLIT